MNALFFTQSSSLDMFYNLMLAIKKSISLEKIGFYVADSRFFKEFKQKYPEIESNSYLLLKEWDIIRDSKDIKRDISLLEQYEKEIGQPYLWNALVADRRIYFGKKYAYDQDYQPRFSHERMLSILQVGLKRIEKFFNEIQPNFIVSFQCNTIGDYLSYLFARARNIPILNLRPTRIRNYFYCGETVMEPSDYLKEIYEQFLKYGIDNSLKDEAEKYLQQAQKTHTMYEGVVAPSNKPPGMVNSKKKALRFLKLKSFLKLLIGEYKFRFGEYRYDNHVSGYIGPFIGQRIIRPWRARMMERRFRKLYVRSKDLPLLNYAFFPLHTEPEVTLSVYSKPYRNQIEAARLFSHNLPIGMKLVVKEHPWAIGRRPLSYYLKLMEIPNVMLAHPSLNSRELASHARLITVIAGAVGLEGSILKKPAIVLGRTAYNFLPNSMIRYAENPERLGYEIQDLLENYEYNEAALLSYISAVMNNSVSIDFYSRLLRRPGVYRENQQQADIDEDKERQNQIERLAKYLINRYNVFVLASSNLSNIE